MEVKVERLGKVSFVVKSRGHLVVSDQPASNGGADVGMTPPELLLSSLGTCVGYYAAQFLEARNLAAEDLEVEVEGEITHNPGRIGRIRIRLRVPGDLEEKQFQALVRTVNHCTIHNTLTHPPEIQLQIETSATVGTF